MKNNIGRKLTSLTLMTIMFAGGMTAAVPSIMPGIFAEGASSPSGLVSVSSAGIQGAQILEIVIDDPAISALDTAIGIPSLIFAGGNTQALQPAQATDGKWYSYIVDDAFSTTADGLTGLNFGTDCGATLQMGNGLTLAGSSWALDTTVCPDADGPDAANDTDSDNLAGEGAANTDGNPTEGNPTNEVLNDAPSLNRNSSANDGQIYATFNTTSASINGVWPYIEQVTMGSDNSITYGGEAVTFTHGSLNGDISVEFSPDTYANGADINFIINDNGLNIDPTELDKWVFAAVTTVGSETLARGFANGTGSVDISGSLNTIGFGDANDLVATGNTGSFCTAVTVEETGDATGVFVTPDANGNSNCDTSATATNYHTATYAYGGDSATVHIAYASASITMDAGDAWMPAESATVTIVDPDANRVNGYDEAMSMETLNAATTIPYIKTGSPVMLGAAEDVNGSVANTGYPFIKVTNIAATTSTFPDQVAAASSGGEPGIYELTLGTTTEAGATHAVYISADYSTAAVTNMTGTVVANYDISSIFDTLVGTSMTIDLEGNTTTGGPADTQFENNATTSAVNSGVGTFILDCCQAGTGIGEKTGGNQTGVEWIFTITNPAAKALAAGVYPVAADFFSFNSTTDVADAIYRLEVEEDGVDGTFTGTVDYATMVHEGNSTNATSVISTNGDAITILLAGDAAGGSAPRILYGDQDASNAQDIIGAQLDVSTHSGTVSFDATSYGTGSIAYVTVNDADLNQDSGSRESYSQQRETSTSTILKVKMLW